MYTQSVRNVGVPETFNLYLQCEKFCETELFNLWSVRLNPGIWCQNCVAEHPLGMEMEHLHIASSMNTCITQSC